MSAELHNYFLSILTILTVQNFIHKSLDQLKCFTVTTLDELRWASGMLLQAPDLSYMYSALHSALRTGSMGVLL